MKYLDIYYFNVLTELQRGYEVFIFDKQEKKVSNAAAMGVIELLNVLKEAEDKGTEDRYYFYKTEEVKE